MNSSRSIERVQQLSPEEALSRFCSRVWRRFSIVARPEVFRSEEAMRMAFDKPARKNNRKPPTGAVPVLTMIGVR